MIKNLISVIVPVYNVEDYIEQCIRSIIMQKYETIEIILIDDGSPDKSGELCDKWAALDSRIRVIHQHNHGAGYARNVGLSLAEGEYISFVDSDDYLSPYFYQSLMDQFTDNVDIVECGYLSTECGQSEFEKYGEPEIVTVSAEEAMRYHISEDLFKQLIWNKLYRHEIIKDIFFPVGKKIDDEYWTYQAIGNARCLVHISTKLYAYRQQVNSVMHQLSENQRFQSVEAKLLRHEYILDNFPSLEAESLHTLWFSSMYCYQKLLTDRSCNNVDSNYQCLKQKLKKYPFSMKHMKTESLKNQIWLIMASISLQTTCKIRNLLHIGV